mgnify:CR=1 FL=1
MTIVVDGDEAILEQIRKQLGKVIDVLKVVDMSGKKYVERDLALIKVNAPPSRRPEIVSLIDKLAGDGELMTGPGNRFEILGFRVARGRIGPVGSERVRDAEARGITADNYTV